MKCPRVKPPQQSSPASRYKSFFGVQFRIDVRMRVVDVAWLMLQASMLEKAKQARSFCGGLFSLL